MDMRQPDTRGWSADEIVRWPLFDPVVLTVSEKGLGVERIGLGARLASRGSIPAVDWSRVGAVRSSTRPAQVDLTFDGERVSVTGAGAERALGLVHAAGAGRPNAARPRLFEGGRPLVGGRSWLAVGPGGLAQRAASALGAGPLQVWAPEELLGARPGLNGGLQLVTETLPPTPIVEGGGVLRALASVLAQRLASWRPEWVGGTSEETAFEGAVVWWSASGRVRLAWLRAAAEGLVLVGADGDRLDAPAETLRNLDDVDHAGPRVRFLAADGEHALRAAGGVPLARGLWGLLRDRMFHAPHDLPLDRRWSRVAGGFLRLRLEDPRGVGWEVGPVRVAADRGMLCVLLPDTAPVQPGETVRVQLVQARRRCLFLAQVAGPVAIEALPAGLRRVAAAAPSEMSSIALRPLQAAPEVATQDRALFRLDLDARGIRIELRFDDAPAWSGWLVDVGGGGVGVRGTEPIPVERGALGELMGLDGVLGAAFARCRVRLMHHGSSKTRGTVAGLRLENLSPSQVDQLHARVIELERAAS